MKNLKSTHRCDARPLTVGTPNYTFLTSNLQLHPFICVIEHVRNTRQYSDYINCEAFFAARRSSQGTHYDSLVTAKSWRDCILYDKDTRLSRPSVSSMTKKRTDHS